MWSALKNKQLAGLRFRCQHPVGNFILDFYCPACKLVVEIDGKIHDRQIEYDNARSSKLAEHGYTVLRFSNERVMNDLPQVLAEIKRVACPPSPPSKTCLRRGNRVFDLRMLPPSFLAQFWGEQVE